MLDKHREKLRDRVEEGILTDRSKDEALGILFQITGNLQAINQYRALDYELLIGELSDE